MAQVLPFRCRPAADAPERAVDADVVTLHVAAPEAFDPAGQLAAPGPHRAPADWGELLELAYAVRRQHAARRAHPSAQPQLRLL